MRCIFCKKVSTSSCSVEHIIPESLGNVDHVLPPGVVCDKCNNYIAREVEKPLLDSHYFKEQRFYATLANKKRRIPLIEGIHLQSLTHIQLAKSIDEPITSIGAGPDADESKWIKSIQALKSGTLIIPIAKKPDDYIISRFVAKVGLEVLAYRTINVEGANNEIVDKPELDELRYFVRQGRPSNPWPYSYRSIYSPDFQFKDGNESFEVLHEFGILVTDKSEYYIVLAIFGDEYALNLGGREIEGYLVWLKMNNNRSPLYSGKNE